MPDARCRECGISCYGTGNIPVVFCSDCMKARRFEGRNRIKVTCQRCAKNLYPEVRDAGNWTGHCPPCMRELRGLPQQDTYDEWRRAFLEAAGPRLALTRFERPDVV